MWAWSWRPVPIWVTPDEIRHLRRLGVTKVQIGVQSLDDGILALNERGHDVEAVRQALGLLRTAGFKLHLHWMPNLYGATPESDSTDFARFFSDPAIRPDELKVYPCSLIAGTELYNLWEAGKYHPYSEAELVALLADVKPTIPPYTRINRLFRGHSRPSHPGRGSNSATCARLSMLNCSGGGSSAAVSAAGRCADGRCGRTNCACWILSTKPIDDGTFPAFCG